MVDRFIKLSSSSLVSVCVDEEERRCILSAAATLAIDEGIYVMLIICRGLIGRQEAMNVAIAKMAMIDDPLGETVKCLLTRGIKKVALFLRRRRYDILDTIMQ